MIYLIDDKVHRQQVDYQRHYAKVEAYNQIFSSITTLDEYHQNSLTIRDSAKVILLHDSFAKGSFNEEKSELTAPDNHEIIIVTFGGSINSCNLEGNRAWLPVDVFYQNLAIFLEQYEKVANQQTTDIIKHLFYGNQPELERELQDKLRNSVMNLINHTNPLAISQHLATKQEKILYIYETDSNRGCRNIFEDATSVGIDLHNPERRYDTLLSQIKTVKYDRIFIPLCFGYSLSDYNGLQLALHIRCTDSPNRLTPVFIYGHYELRSLIDNKFSGVLRLSNVHHIDFSQKGFLNSLTLVTEESSVLTLKEEIRKVNLQLPANFTDDHSLANEYGALVFARAAGLEDKLSYEIKDLEEDIYFKWLLTSYTPWHTKSDGKKTQLFQPVRTSLPGLKVVGKIDLTR